MRTIRVGIGVVGHPMAKVKESSQTEDRMVRHLR
jgi:hypothetical protein